MENPPITQPAIEITSNIEPIAFWINSVLFNAKLSSSVGFSPLLALNKPVISFSKETKPMSSSFPLAAIVGSIPFLPV